jgi:ABC-type Fe3+/spermidine/putrescine transport system ATPase subunit
MSSESSVDIVELRKSFGSVRAVDAVTLRIGRGEFFSLLGPSGCGKTTLLRLIAGLEQPDDGSLKVEGREMAGVEPYHRPVNTVFQQYALFPHLSVEQNVAFGLRYKRVAKTEWDRRVSEALALVRLSGMERRKPDQLSGGQKQRVALARALVLEPAVLLLDEPLGALDQKLRREMQIELKSIQRKLGITFIFVTHDQEEALTMSDRIAVMNGGKVEQVGAAAEVFERPRTRFVADFMGAANFMSRATGETFVVRPEKLRLSASGPGVEVTIEQRVYQGISTVWTVRTSKGDRLTVYEQNDELRSVLEVGGRGVVTWHAEHEVTLG